MLLSREIKCNVQTRMFSNCDVFSLPGSASTEVPRAAGGVEEETHRRAEEQRHGPARSGGETLSHSSLSFFLRLRKGGETLRSLSRSGGRRSWPGTRRGSPGWSRRGGTAGGTLSSPLAALLPGWWNPGWTQPQDIGAAGGKTEILGDF